MAYLANGSRPDILYAVNQLSRRQSKPTVQDYEYVKRVFRYLRGTESYGLVYRGKNDLVESFSDASHRDCIESARSTTGFVIMTFGDLVHWASRRQTSVSKATCESEYKAMNETARELNYLRGVLRRLLGKTFRPSVMNCDSESAMLCTAKPGVPCLRHLTDVKDHYIMECIRDQRVTLERVSSVDNLADILTKPLAREQFQKLRDLLVEKRK